MESSKVFCFFFVAQVLEKVYDYLCFADAANRGSDL